MERQAHADLVLEVDLEVGVMADAGAGRARDAWRDAPWGNMFGLARGPAAGSSAPERALLGVGDRFLSKMGPIPIQTRIGAVSELYRASIVYGKPRAQSLTIQWSNTCFYGPSLGLRYLTTH